MRSLVTGGAGFIGSAIARALIDRGDDVVVLDNFLSGSKAAVPSGADVVEGDVRDLETVKSASEGAEVVFHQAAVRSVPRSIDEPVLVHESNVTGTLNVLVAAEAAGVRRVVYASSSSVYGGAGDGATSEDLAPNPLSPYAVSKLAAEYYCRVWAGLNKVSTVCLRYFNVFGPGQRADSRYAAVFPAFIAALSQGSAPDIHWDGEQSRDFTFISDVVRANLLAADNPAAHGGVINVAPGEPRTINDVFRSISASLGTQIEPTRTAPRAGDIRSSYADNTLARELLGWRPEAGWNESIQTTIEWFQAVER